MECQTCGACPARVRVNQVDENGVAVLDLCIACGKPFTVQPLERVDHREGEQHFRVLLLPEEMDEGCERHLPVTRGASCPDCEADPEAMQSCSTCRGRGSVAEQVTVRVTIPPGVSASKLLRVRGKGDVRLCDGKRGDLYLHVATAAQVAV